MNIVALLACRPLKLPTVICERSNPARQDLGVVWEWLRRRTYPYCRAAVAQTRAVAEQLQTLVRNDRVRVIPNGVKEPKQFWAEDPNRPPRILAIGRLSREKGFDLLIRAFASLAGQQSDWELQIAGEGKERSSLEKLVSDLNLDVSVRLPGWVQSPIDLLCSSRIFVLPSRYEGFPNSLLEAMAAGAPVVAFDCECGPGEIIQHEVNGLLVPSQDVEALAREMKRLMLDAPLRVRLGERARDVVHRYNSDNYFQCWDQLLEECLGSKANESQ
jgi:glycosyltransferase involved in cell wall biosynthesis